MKVLLVVHGFPPENVGGTELYVARLARALGARGHEVVVFAGTLRYEDEEPRIEAFEHDGLRGYWLLRADIYFDSWEKSYCARTGRLFQEVVERERPDLVHVHHWVRLSRDLVHRAASAGVRSVVTLHDLWSTCLICFRVKADHSFCTADLAPENCLDCVTRPPWMGLREGERAVHLLRDDVANELALARRRIVPSAAHGALIARVLGRAADDFSVVPHGLPGPLARSAPRAGVPGRDRALVVACWSHLYPLKGQQVLLAAVRAMRHRDRVQVHLLGDCWEPEHEARLHALAEGSDVTFHGRFVHADLEALHADLAVMPTLCHESYSFVLDEAQALGWPVLATRLGALTERLGGGGAFFERGDEGELAEQLDAVVEEPGLLDRWRAALPSPARFEQNVEALEQLYAEVLREPFDPGADRFDGEAHQAFEAYRSEQRHRWILRWSGLPKHARNLERRVAELEEELRRRGTS